MKAWAALLCFVLSTAALPAPSVPVLRVSGPLNPGTGEYLSRGIAAANRSDAPFLVIVLDSEGGLLQTARNVVQEILESRLPVVAFLGPAGAAAGAPAALLLMASDVAAMAPGARLAGPTDAVSDEFRANRDRLEAESTDLADHVARARGRSAHGSLRAMRSKEPVNGESALKEGIVDLVADDLPALLAKMNGWRLRVPKGEFTVLGEPGTPVEVELSLWQKILGWVANAKLAYGLLLFSALCLGIELGRSGHFRWAVTGILSLMLSLFSFYWLPISYGSLALAILGLGLVAIECFYPTYGLFGLLGLGAFLSGSLWVMDTAAPDFQLGLGVILGAGALVSAGGFALSQSIRRGRRQRKRSGLDALVGEYGQARGKVNQERGKVFVQGELWAAVTEAAEEIGEGALVVVTGVRGVLLIVSPKR